MTVPKALDNIQQLKLTNATELEQIASLLSGGQLTNTFLGDNSHKKKAPGYSGIDGARKMLNEMIFESLSKYDAEIAKCTEFYAKQCALMEVARGQIAAANFVAANSRALILDAQYNINKCEVSIPELKQELKEHNLKCKNELKKLNTRLKIVMGDIAVITMILKMTDCETKFVQMNKKFMMLRCENQCTKKHYVRFNHQDLQQKVTQLKSSTAVGLVQEGFEDFFDEETKTHSVALLQADSAGFQEPEIQGGDEPMFPNKTKFNNPPVPKTQVPGNPCIDPYQGAPSPEDKRAAKCTIKKSPQCFKLQSRFLAIQGGIADERDKLM